MRDRKIYMDFSRGQKDGAIRFSEPAEEIAKLCQQLNGGDLEVAGSKVESAAILEGEEETKYWTNFIDFKNKQLKERAGKRNNNNKRRRHS